MFLSNLFKRESRPVDSTVGFIRLAEIVRETKIFPEIYLIQVGISLGIHRDIVPELIFRDDLRGDTKLTTWAIKEVVHTFLRERGLFTIEDYKRMVNVINRYGYTIEIIDEAIAEFAKSNLPFPTDKQIA